MNFKPFRRSVLSLHAVQVRSGLIQGFAPAWRLHEKLIVSMTGGWIEAQFCGVSAGPERGTTALSSHESPGAEPCQLPAKFPRARTNRGSSKQWRRQHAGAFAAGSFLGTTLLGRSATCVTAAGRAAVPERATAHLSGESKAPATLSGVPARPRPSPACL
jgi:hypothetical protein